MSCLKAKTLSLHIRAVGHWTNSLYQYFEKEQAKLEGTTVTVDKRSRLRETISLAKDRARKLSTGIGARNSSSLALGLGNRGMSSISLGLGNPGNLGLGNPMASPLGNPMPGQALPSASSVNLWNQGNQGIGRGTEEGALPVNAKMVARSFRYMRRKPTIMAYRTPTETIEEEDPCSSNHFILDRIAEKESTDNLHRSGSEHEEVEDADIRQVNQALHVYIRGPFGAPTSRVFQAQHAVLIGTGIGVTPYASILQSIMHRYWAARNTCPKCSYRWTNDLSSQVMNLRKVDFFWINREQRSFEWFVSLLSQLEIEQAEQGGAMERFLDMHMYITSALQKTDMKAVGLQLALELLHQKSKRDLITGLKTRTIAGRPNWDKVFRDISNNRKGRVTVFFCGPPQLSKILKQKCRDFGFDYRKENF